MIDFANKNKRLTIFILSVISGLMLGMSWPVNGIVFLVFLGFIPLLYIEDYFYRLKKGEGKQLFLYTYPAFFIWNFYTTWWVYKASFFGGAAAIICNAFFMSMVFQVFHFTRVKKGNITGFASLIFYWIGFEYLHLNWDLSWPWLTLGNAFSNTTGWIQWYEYTGVFGGSLWILSVNIFIFHFIQYVYNSGKIKDKQAYLKILIPALLILVPILISRYIYSNYKENKSPVNIVVVQPNIDPYHEKFSESSESQIEKFISLANSAVDSSTLYLVGPETALPDGIWEEEIHYSKSVQMLKEFLSKYPNLKLITGLSSFRRIHEADEGTATRKSKEQNINYEAYNTAIQINPDGNITFYHKSKLVPGVEQMPYPAIFGFFEKFAIDLGGTSGSLGKQKERSVFTSKENISIAAAICYESIYGDFLSGFIRNHANLLFIITNDGWWGDTPGYRQHLSYGKLRAIEFRRDIARSANTGISCFINSRGEIRQATEWWKPAVIKDELNKNDVITFYAKHGDYLGVICSFFSVFVFLISLFTFKNKL